jgi:hypothetical protein
VRALNTIKNFWRKDYRAGRKGTLISKNHHFVAEQHSAKSLIFEDIAELLSTVDRKIFLLYLEDIGFCEV